MCESQCVTTVRCFSVWRLYNKVNICCSWHGNWVNKKAQKSSGTIFIDCVCVCFSQLLHTEYQNTHSTSKVRTFFWNEDILRSSHKFKGWLWNMVMVRNKALYQWKVLTNTKVQRYVLVCFLCTCACGCACENLALSAVALNGMWNNRALIKSKQSGRFDYSFGSQGILSRRLAKKNGYVSLKKPTTLDGNTYISIQQWMAPLNMTAFQDHIITFEFIAHVSIA